MATYGDQIAGLVLDADLGKKPVTISATRLMWMMAWVRIQRTGGGFRGVQVVGIYNSTIRQNLFLVGLKLKVTSGDTDEDKLALMGEKILGHEWRATEDVFVF